MPENKTVRLVQTSPMFFDNQIMRIDQAAEMIKVSKWHLYRLVSQEKIPFRKKGKILYFIKRELFDWISNGD